jgi:Asp-tRNA(Asn)/Glu-tRNA(Gln) amidotransferase C subunit
MKKRKSEDCVDRLEHTDYANVMPTATRLTAKRQAWLRSDVKIDRRLDATLLITVSPSTSQRFSVYSPST